MRGGPHLYPERQCALHRQPGQDREAARRHRRGHRGTVRLPGPGAVADRFGYRTPVLLRTVEELGETIRKNPFLEAGAPEDWLHVLFLASQPDAQRVAALDPLRSPTDAYAVRGREIYLQCPNGVGNTKLTCPYFDSRLATVSTGRNWRTVLKLFELAQA